MTALSKGEAENPKEDPSLVDVSTWKSLNNYVRWIATVQWWLACANYLIF
jgi:hypothetical protein